MNARLFGLAAMFTGAALLSFLLTGIPLSVTLPAFALGALVVAAWAWRRSPPSLRVRIQRQAVAGLAAGFVAVVAYDAVRLGLASLAPSPYNAFEALRGMGRALLGESADPRAQWVVGTSFHVVTGTLFGLGYISLVADTRRSGRLSWVGRGVAYALFLEIFQLLLYPHWLGIVFVREFTIFATAGHITYGIVLGLVARQLQLRFDRREPWQA